MQIAAVELGTAKWPAIHNPENGRNHRWSAKLRKRIRSLTLANLRQAARGHLF